MKINRSDFKSQILWTRKFPVTMIFKLKNCCMSVVLTTETSRNGWLELKSVLNGEFNNFSPFPKRSERRIQRERVSELICSKSIYDHPYPII